MDKRLVIVRDGDRVGALMEVTRETGKRLYGRGALPAPEERVLKNWFPGLSGGPTWKDRSADWYVDKENVLFDNATEDQWRALFALSKNQEKQRNGQRAQHRDAERKLIERHRKEIADLASEIGVKAQAIEAQRAETGTGSVHESAVGNADAPSGERA
jgi:hypothetical protein